MRRVLIFASLAEGSLGLLLVAYPPIVIQLLFGAEVEGIGTITSRVAGVALIGLGIACWPSRRLQVGAPHVSANLGDNHQQIYGMLTYSILVTLYLIRIGIRGAPVGQLLWPAVVVHAVLIALFIAGVVKGRKAAAK
ncbi:MAG TPA: hypothetical protein VMU45_07485 [Candidatus Eisenbacteria bacterium]|nr:hypothetical protein [Candidatus Eisenbacteria bacterium]